MTCIERPFAHAAVAILSLVWVLALWPATSRAADAALDQAIARGKENFTHNTFGGSGRYCESCHLQAGTQPGKLPDGEPIPSLTNAAAIFPRVRSEDNALITLPDQVRTCVARALKGNPPAYGSDELNSLVSYVTSLSQGKPIDMGGTAR